MATYSHSKLSTFEQCKQKYKFQYILKIRIPGQSIEAFMGSMVHDTLEKLYEDVKHAKIPELNDILQDYKRRWDAKYNPEEIRIVRQDYVAQNYFDMGVKFLADYYDHHKPFDDGVILGLETTDFLDLGNGDKFHVRIDRLMEDEKGIYSVNDYKTNKSLPSQEKLDQDRQLAIYSLWVHERYDDAVKVKLVWHFLAHDRHMVSERSLDELYKLKDEIIARIKEVKACDTFFTNVTPLCNWCEYKQAHCPAWGHQLKTETLDKKEFLEDDGVKLVNKLKELNDNAKKTVDEIEKVKKELIEYSKQFELSIIVGNDTKVKILETDSLKLPKKGTKQRDELDEKLKSLGMYDSLLTLDSFAIKKLDTDMLNKLDLEKEKTYSVRLMKK